MGRIITIITFFALTSLVATGQDLQPCKKSPDSADRSEAYLMVAASRARAEAEMANALNHLTSTHPDVPPKQYKLDFLAAAMKEMSKIQGSNVSALDRGFGLLVLRRVEIETELRSMLDSFTPDFPDVVEKRAELAAHQRLLERYSAAY
jgi:hypothetical protein